MKPTLCAECAKIIEESHLHFVECGGINVGMHRQPKVWRLRYKDEHLTVQQRTKDLQRLAGAIRLLAACIPQLPPDLAKEIKKFIKS